MGKVKAVLIKFCRYAPPIITQIATFVATRALANEYDDYGRDRSHIPLGAKITLIAVTIISAITGIFGVIQTRKTSDKSKLVKIGDLLLGFVALGIAIYAAVGMLQTHPILKAEGEKCFGPNMRVSPPACRARRQRPRRPAPAPDISDERGDGTCVPSLEPPLKPLTPLPSPRPPHLLLLRCACHPKASAPTQASRRAISTWTQ